MKKILFVCSGNTCRSPMAAGWFNHLSAENQTEMMAVSAGTSVKAAQSNPASDHAITVMADLGVDLHHHVSQRITSKMAAGYDLIAVMGKKEEKELLSLIPEIEGKIFLLMHFSKLNPGKDVPNPYKGDLKKYRKCFETMAEAVENLFCRCQCNEISEVDSAAAKIVQNAEESKNE